MVGKREERKEGVDGGMERGAKMLNNWRFCHSVADNNSSRKERTGQGKEKEKKEEEEVQSCSSCSSQLTAQKSILLRLRLAPPPPATIPPSREREARKGKYYVFTERPPLHIFLKQTRPAPTWP